MPRQLVPILDFVKEAEERGDDLSSFYIDPEEVAELDFEDQSDED